MGCQKSLQLITGVKTQQAPELRFAQRTLLIRTDGIFFEDVTGDIVPIHLPHLLGDIIRNMYTHFHDSPLSRARLPQACIGLLSLPNAEDAVNVDTRTRLELLCQGDENETCKVPDEKRHVAWEKIEGHEVLYVVLQEGLPRRGRWFLGSRAILLYRGFRNLDAQLAQFPTMRGDPSGIRLPHRLNQVAHLLSNGGPARLALLAQVLPVVAEPLALPGDDLRGWTNARAPCQSGHSRASHTQNSRADICLHHGQEWYLYVTTRCRG
jgi:hypothetical protein